MAEVSIPKPEARSDPDLSGRRIGDYQLLRRLGRGGMAEVYLAEQLSLHRQVAFKVLKGSLAGDEAYIRRFHNEARAAANLVHANIVQIHEVGCIDGIHFIAQEYVAGQNLKQLLARRGKGLDAPLVATILRQVAAALHKAAEHAIIHRDIKPENIMLSPTGEVKVADFGLARMAKEGSAVDLTQVGITMGTPLYMSPEQVEGRAVDPRSDLYSLGITCYQMLAGRPPFDGDSALAIAVQQLKSEPVRLESLRPDITPGLCRIIHKMLAKKPQDRFQKPAELLKELRSLPIEGLAENWQSDLSGWTTTEFTATSEGRAAATQMLATVLGEQPSAAPARWRAWLIAAMVLMAIPAGGLAAWLARPKPLLTFSQTELPKVPRMETAEEQYWNAVFAQADAEPAWKAVSEYFPPSENETNKLYGRRASQRLAELYLRKDQLVDALALYQQLSSVEEAAEEFHLVGLAGEAIVNDRLKQQNEVIARLVKLMPKVESLNDEFLKLEIKRLAERYQLDAPDTSP